MDRKFIVNIGVTVLDTLDNNNRRTTHREFVILPTEEEYEKFKDHLYKEQKNIFIKEHLE